MNLLKVILLFFCTSLKVSFPEGVINNSLLFIFFWSLFDFILQKIRLFQACLLKELLEFPVGVLLWLIAFVRFVRSKLVSRYFPLLKFSFFEG